MFVFDGCAVFFFDLLRTPDVIQNVNQRLSGRFYDIGSNADAVEAAAIVIRDDINLTQCVFTLAFR